MESTRRDSKEDPTEAAFWDALGELADALERERRDPVTVIGSWSGVRKSTVYEWLGRRETPKRWEYVWRLAVNSTSAGYPEFMAGMAKGVRLTPAELPPADGSLANETEAKDRLWGEVWAAFRAGNGSALCRIAHGLHAVADSVYAEGARLATVVAA